MRDDAVIDVKREQRDTDCKKVGDHRACGDLKQLPAVMRKLAPEPMRCGACVTMAALPFGNGGSRPQHAPGIDRQKFSRRNLGAVAGAGGVKNLDGGIGLRQYQHHLTGCHHCHCGPEIWPRCRIVLDIGGQPGTAQHQAKRVQIDIFGPGGDFQPVQQVGGGNINPEQSGIDRSKLCAGLGAAGGTRLSRRGSGCAGAHHLRRNQDRPPTGVHVKRDETVGHIRLPSTN